MKQTWNIYLNKENDNISHLSLYPPPFTSALLRKRGTAFSQVMMCICWDTGRTLTSQALWLPEEVFIPAFLISTHVQAHTEVHRRIFTHRIWHFWVNDFICQFFHSLLLLKTGISYSEERYWVLGRVWHQFDDLKQEGMGTELKCWKEAHLAEPSSGMLSTGPILQILMWANCFALLSSTQWSTSSILNLFTSDLADKFKWRSEVGNLKWFSNPALPVIK